MPALAFCGSAITCSPADKPWCTSTRVSSALPVCTARKRARPSSTTSTPIAPSRLRVSADSGTRTPAAPPVSIDTCASWSIAKRAGGVSNATLTSSSRVAASDWRAMRATVPDNVSPLRSRIAAFCPVCTRPTTDSSTRIAIHKVAGSTRRKIALPGTTVAPTSASRAITTASIGATMRVNDSWVSE
jgi:hypothetical protein